MYCPCTISRLSFYAKQKELCLLSFMCHTLPLTTKRFLIVMRTKNLTTKIINFVPIETGIYLWIIQFPPTGMACRHGGQGLCSFLKAGRPLHRRRQGQKPEQHLKPDSW